MASARRQGLPFGMLLSIAAAAAGPSAMAAPAPAQDPRAVEAYRACVKGEHQRGIAMLTDLYLETRNPTYVYNQARCDQQNGRHGQAVERFREYLRVAGQLPAPELAEVQRHIRESEAAAGQATERPPADSTGTEPTTTPPATTPPVSPTGPPDSNQPPIDLRPPPSASPPAAPVETPGLASSTSSRPRRLAGQILLGAGLGLLAGAALSSWTVYRYDRDNRRVYDEGKDRWGPRLEKLQWVGYAASALSAGAGTTLLLLDAERRPSDGASRLTVGYQGRF